LNPRSAIVADDDEDARFLVVAALRRAGFRVTEAADGFELLAIADDCDVSTLLVVSDIGMPGCDGIAATRLLRGRAPTLPIVLITANTDLETKEGALLAGADCLFYKPLDLRQLVDTVVDLAARPS
jgi:DNA-binding response OmpR family regulator